MSALVSAVERNDLQSVKRLVAEGADVKETTAYGFTPFLRAAGNAQIPIMHWLLTEGGSSLAERSEDGVSALLQAAYNGKFTAMQYLLEEQGASMSESDVYGVTVWSALLNSDSDYPDSDPREAELSSLLKVMVILDDAPTDFIAELSPQHAKLCTRGRQLRALLPSYLEQQLAAVIVHCPLLAVLQSLVAEYAATTTGDMWADGLRVQAPHAKRARAREDQDEEDGENEPLLRKRAKNPFE
jgi:hypothetical protein